MDSTDFLDKFLGITAKMKDDALPLQVQEVLDRPLPAQAIKQHPTKTYLSTIKPIFVIDRLNEAFGRNGWYADYEIIDNSKADIIVKGYLFVPAYGILLTNFGGNDNGGSESRNFDQGDAYKGAFTDALTKMASYIGIGADIWRGAAHQPPRNGAQRPPTNYPPRRTPQTITKKALGEKGFNAVVSRFNKGEHDIIGKTMKIFELTPPQLAIVEQLKKKAAAASQA